MALTNTQVSAMWRHVFQKATGKTAVKSGTMPTEMQITNLFNAIEDYYIANQAGLKTAIETAVGFTLTTEEVDAYVKSWLEVKNRGTV